MKNSILPMTTFYLQTRKTIIFTDLKTDSSNENFLFSKKKNDFYQVKNPILPMTTFYLQRRKNLFLPIKRLNEPKTLFYQ